MMKSQANDEQDAVKFISNSGTLDFHCKIIKFKKII